MSLELSYRLKAVASYLPSQMHIADIGGDHAFLLLSLAKQKRLKKGIVGEKNEGPFQNAKKNVALTGYAALIDVRKGDGLRVLYSNEVDVVVIAGMGGLLIRQILENGKDKLAGVQRLVLQPNNASFHVREWLVNRQYKITTETIVEENNILYEIIVAEPGVDVTQYSQTAISYGQLLQIGPILWKDKHPLLKRKLEEETLKKERVIRQLQLSDHEESKMKQIFLEQEVKLWEKAIRLLSKESI